MGDIEHDATVPIVKITEETDRVIVDVGDEDVIDAEIVIAPDPPPRMRWRPESWRLDELDRFPHISASIMQLRDGEPAYAYLYRVDADPARVLWRGERFDSLEAAEAAVEAFLVAQEASGGYDRIITTTKTERPDVTFITTSEEVKPAPCQD